MKKMIQSKDVSNFILNLCLLFISVGLALTYLNYNPYDIEIVLKGISLTIIILNLPDIIKLYYQKKYNLFVDPAILIVIALLGYFISVHSLLLYLIALFCLSIKAVSIINHLKTITSKWFKFLIFLLLSICMSLLFSISFYTAPGFSPFFIDTVISDTVHIDMLYHISITNFIKEYLIPSIGLHGLKIIPYHFGSHFLFAGLSGLLNEKPAVFYNHYYPLIFIPFYIKGFYIFSKQVSKFIKSNYYILLFLSLFLIIIITFQKAITGFILHPFVSESQCVAIALSFYILAGIIKTIDSNTNQSKDMVLLFIISVLSTIVLTITKISIGYLFYVFTAYLFFRLFSLRSKLFIYYSIIGGIIVISFWSFFISTTRTFTSSLINIISKPEVYILILIIALFLVFYKHILKIKNIIKIIIAGLIIGIAYFTIQGNIPNMESLILTVTRLEIYLWLPVLLFLVIIKENLLINFNSKISEIYYSKKYLIIECLIIMAIFGALPGLLILKDKFNVFYFTSYQAYMGFAIIISYILKFTYDNHKINFNYNISSKISIILIYLLFTYIFITLAAIDNKNIKIRYSHNFEIIRNKPEFQNLIYKLNDYKFDKNAVIFVQNREFYKDTKSSFVIPAITQRPQLYGLPTARPSRYGMSSYRNIIYLPDKTPEEIISQAKKLGFTQLVVIDTDLNFIKIPVSGRR